MLEALELFAEHGYAAVSVSMIASKLGITKGALYRHYESKHNILESIVKKMEQNDYEGALQSGVPTENPHNDGIDESLTLDLFGEYCKKQLKYWTEDSFAVCFRRMLSIERYGNEDMRRLYEQYISIGPLSYTEAVFRSLGVEYSEKRAAELYSIMYLYYEISDSQPEKMPFDAELLIDELISCLKG